MFTGLIQKVGQLAGLERKTGETKLIVTHDPWDKPLEPGESIAVQGICLTVTSATSGRFNADVLDETLNRTSLESKRTGSMLNLERAMRAEDVYGGHMVTGHIDGTGKVSAIRTIGTYQVIEIKCRSELMTGMVAKGSIACDGISLTIAMLKNDSFEVHIIPHTFEHTSLRELRVGEAMNMETDVIGKYVRRYMEELNKAKSNINMETLTKTGFV